MEIFSTYSVKIKHYNHIFKETFSLYREAVDFLYSCMFRTLGYPLSGKKQREKSQYLRAFHT